MRTWSGVARIKIDETIELMQLDFPAPVAPAIKRWGMAVRLSITG